MAEMLVIEGGYGSFLLVHDRLVCRSEVGKLLRRCSSEETEELFDKAGEMFFRSTKGEVVLNGIVLELTQFLPGGPTEQMLHLKLPTVAGPYMLVMAHIDLLCLSQQRAENVSKTKGERAYA